MDDYLQIFDHTGDGVWAVDKDQRIIYWNHAATELLGFSAEEAIGKQCYQLLSGLDGEGRPYCKEECTIFQQLQQGKRVSAHDLQVQRKDGKIAWINVSSIPILEEGSDTPAAVVKLFRLIGTGPQGTLPLQLHFLGRTMVQRADGTMVAGPHWRRAKVRALLAHLAVRRNRSVHRDEIIHALWPDLEYSSALTNLNTTVYYLRRSLEPNLKKGSESAYVQYEADRYVLDGGTAHWVDVEAFQAGIVQARRQEDPIQAIEQYREALALYKGDFLIDIGLDLAWVWVEQDRLRELYLHTLQEMATLCAQQRMDTTAQTLLEQVLATDPCRENACQEIMRLCMRSGDRATALTHYHRLSEALWSELDVLPSTATTLLYEQAMRG